MEKKSSQTLKLITILAMMFLYAMISFVTNLAAPVGKIWGNSFEGNDAELLGMLGNLMNFAAYLIMGIPSGHMLTKLGYKKTSLIAVAVGLLGVVVQWFSGVSSSFIIYLTGAFIAGFSVCMLNAVVNPMLNLIGGGGNKGNQLNLIGGSINSLAGSLTPMLVGAIIGKELAGKTIADVNIVLYMAMAVFAIVFVILFFTPIAEPAGAGQKIEYEKSAWCFHHFVLGAIAIFFYVGVEVGIPATLISYLEKSGNGFNTGGFIAGIYWLLMLCGRFIGSAIGGKVSSRAMVTCCATVALILIASAMMIDDTIKVEMISNWEFGLECMPLAAVLLMCCGLCTSVMWGCIFNMAVEGLGKYTAQASGIFMMMVVGGGIIPFIQSGIAGAFGCMISYIVPAIGVAYILFYALIGSRNVNKDIKID